MYFIEYKTNGKWEEAYSIRFKTKELAAVWLVKNGDVSRYYRISWLNAYEGDKNNE